MQLMLHSSFIANRQYTGATVGVRTKLTMCMWFITVVVLAVSTWLLWKYLKGGSRSELPGPWGLPIIGYLPFLDTKRPNLAFLELAKKYGDVFQLRIGSGKMVVVNGHRAVMQLSETTTEFLGKPDDLSSRLIFKNVMIDNFIFAPFSLSNWIHKKILFKVMERFVTERAQDIEETVHKIVRMVADDARKRNRQPFDPAALCLQAVCALVIYHTYGRLPSVEDEEVEEVLQRKSTAEKVTTDLKKINLFPWLEHLPIMWKSIERFKEGMQRYRDIHDKFAVVALDNYDGKTRRCFMDFLCHEFTQLNDEDNSILKVPVDDKELNKKMSCNISFFGTLTPLTIGVKWIIFLTALHPDVQRKVRDEIKLKIGDNRKPSLQDADSLPFTTAAFQEITRYVSMAALAIRATTCDTKLDGYFIPKDTSVTFNLYSANRDGSVFSNPDKFEPQRFLNADGTLNSDAYKDVIPIGLGPRRCGGMPLWWLELYTFFASLVQCCHIEQAPDCPLDATDYYFDIGVVPSPFKVVIY